MKLEMIAARMNKYSVIALYRDHDLQEGVTGAWLEARWYRGVGTEVCWGKKSKVNNGTQMIADCDRTHVLSETYKDIEHAQIWGQFVADPESALVEAVL